MAGIRELPSPTGAGLDAAAFAGCAWLCGLRVARVADRLQLHTGDAETCALLLSGTFDLQGGGTVWQSRGARATPFLGRPMAVFLPPLTPFAAAGSGEILLVAARQPAAAEPETGRAALSRKPLLPLAGSGKAFDPGSGEWKPAETFPTAPESLPPRRMHRDDIDGIAVERVFGVDYKAATLSVDEAVIPAGTTLRPGRIPGLARASELLVFVRSEGRARVGGADDGHDVLGDGAFVLPWRPDADLAIGAIEGACYVVLAFAGK